MFQVESYADKWDIHDKVKNKRLYYYASEAINMQTKYQMHNFIMYSNSPQNFIKFGPVVTTQLRGNQIFSKKRPNLAIKQ